MKVELPEFHGHVFPMRIVLVRDAAEWQGLMRHMELDRVRPSAPATACWFERHGYDDIVALHLNEAQVNHRSFTERIALYAHECVHVAQYAAKIIGSRLGSEVEAYLVQALLLWVIGECEEWQ